MTELILIMWLIFVVLLIIGIELIVFVNRKPKPPNYIIRHSNPSGVKFVIGFTTFILALIGGGVFLLIMYVMDIYPERELLTFGVPLLFAFAFANAFFIALSTKQK